MPITVNEGGVLCELVEVAANEGGTLHNFDTIYSNENGVLYEVFSGKILSWIASSNTTIVSVNNKGLTVVFKPLSYNSENGIRRIYSDKFSLKAGQKLTYAQSSSAKATTLSANLYRANGTKVGSIYSNTLTKGIADIDGDYYI